METNFLIKLQALLNLRKEEIEKTSFMLADKEFVKLVEEIRQEMNAIDRALNMPYRY